MKGKGKEREETKREEKKGLHSIKISSRRKGTFRRGFHLRFHAVLSFMHTIPRDHRAKREVKVYLRGSLICLLFSFFLLLLPLRTIDANKDLYRNIEYDGIESVKIYCKFRLSMILIQYIFT